LRRGFAGQGADHVIGFVARQFEDRNAICLERAPDVGHLLHQFRRHLAAIGLIAVIFNFLEGLGLQVEPAYLGDGLGFGITEGGCGHVEYRSQVFWRKVLAQFAQHVDEDVGGRGRQAGLGGHAALPRHGVVGAEDERHRIHEKDAAAIGGCQPGRSGCRLRRRSAFGWRSREFSSRRQELSLAGQSGQQRAPGLSAAALDSLPFSHS
jgi:hypothetical protein